MHNFQLRCKRMILRLLKPFVAILLMLVIGMGIGTLLMVSSSLHTDATVDIPQTSATPISNPSIRPALSTVAQSTSEPLATARCVGVTFARQSADILARSEGRLEAIYVNLGDHLKLGTVIARVESISVTQQLEMAEASLRSSRAEERNAEAERKEAEARYRRREGLVEAGVLSKEELATTRVQVEKAEANLEVMRARVAEQKARVEQTKDSLANTVIKATFEGTVAARYLDPGATVHSGTPVISLIRSNDLWVRFAIPETKQAAVNVGSTVRFYIEGLGVTIPAVIEHLSPGVAAMSQELI